MITVLQAAVAGEETHELKADLRDRDLTSELNSEIHSNHHVEVDILMRLKDNMDHLDELHSRLLFMMKEINGLIKRR